MAAQGRLLLGDAAAMGMARGGGQRAARERQRHVHAPWKVDRVRARSRRRAVRIKFRSRTCGAGLCRRAGVSRELKGTKGSRAQQLHMKKQTHRDATTSAHR